MVSIIVPVFNVASYIGAAIESVKSQSYTDWELILIDDGSSDGSSEICDKVAAGDRRIKVIHKANGGLSSARNAGLDNATGDFVVFLDGDDILPPNALKKLFTWQNKTDADIVCGKMKKFFSSEYLNFSNDYKFKLTPDVLSGSEAVERILYQKDLDNSASNKLYRASLWNNIRFREKVYYEDLDIFYHVFLRAEKVTSVPDMVYLYRQHPASYLHKFNLGRKDMIDVTSRLSQYMRENHPDLLPAALSRQLSANFNMLMLLAANMDKMEPAEKEKAKKIERDCWLIIKKLRKKCLRDNNVRLKNKTGIILSYSGLPLLKALGKLTYR